MVFTALIKIAACLAAASVVTDAAPLFQGGDAAAGGSMILPQVSMTTADGLDVGSARTVTLTAILEQVTAKAAAAAVQPPSPSGPQVAAAVTPQAPGFTGVLSAEMAAVMAAQQAYADAAKAAADSAANNSNLNNRRQAGLIPGEPVYAQAWQCKAVGPAARL